MSGCHHCGFDRFFDEKFAAKELRRYLKRGPIRSTALLIESLAAEGVEGSTLLDIGGGVGVLQHELLERGVSEAVDVDGSPAYIATASAETKRRGHGGRVTYIEGDFVELSDSIAPADIVTLDRVICCYPDMPALVGPSTANSKRIYGLVYPRYAWHLRVACPILNLVSRLKKCLLRLYLHDPEEIDRLVREAGFERRAIRRTFVWEVVVYERVSDAA